jgi:hypothetical protein
MKKKLSKIFGIGLAVTLLASLMLVSAPVGAISTPTVTLSTGDNVISAACTYTIFFQISTALTGGAGNDEIVVTFPTGTDCSGLLLTDVTVGATSGIGVGALATNNPAAVGVGATNNILEIQPQGNIGAGATVQVVAGLAAANEVVNAPGLGTYTLSVGTQTNVPAVIEAAVDSNEFTLVEPTPTPLPGVVKYYNSADVLINQTNSIVTAVAACSAGWSIEVYQGTYDENATITIPAGVTVEAPDGPVVTVITDANLAGGGGDVVLGGAAAVLDGFTVTGGVTVNANATVQNCVLSNAAGAALSVATGTGATTPGVSSNNTITGAAGQTGLNVAAGNSPHQLVTPSA